MTKSMEINKLFSSFIFDRFLYAVEELASLARAAPFLLVIGGASAFTHDGVTPPGVIKYGFKITIPMVVTYLHKSSQASSLAISLPSKKSSLWEVVHSGQGIWSEYIKQTEALQTHGPSRDLDGP